MTTASPALPGTVTIRPGAPADTPAVAALFASQLLREPNLRSIEDGLAQAPSALAFDAEELVGFVYCGAWAPDIMEVLNLLVADTHRSLGLGSALLGAAEGAMPAHIRGILLENSDLYGAVRGGKRPATAFYVANGYAVVADTGATRVFWKGLGSAPS